MAMDASANSVKGAQSTANSGSLAATRGRDSWESLSDSHESLPRVAASDSELAADLMPFTALADAPMAMTAHVIYEAWDAEHCASVSATVIQERIRQHIGFDGLLISDDLDMKALSGGIPARAEAVLSAGCDIALNCWGRLDDMRGIAEQVPPLSLIHI